MKAEFMMKVCEGNEDIGDIAQFMSGNFVFVAELKDCNLGDFEEGKEYDLDVTFFGHRLDGIYKTEEEYRKHNGSMAPESCIPCGAFPAGVTDKNWEPSPMNIINSRVKERVYPRDMGWDDVNYLLFYGEIFGVQIDQVYRYDNEEDIPPLANGDIVSGLYWAEVKLL